MVKRLKIGKSATKIPNKRNKAQRLSQWWIFHNRSTAQVIGVGENPLNGNRVHLFYNKWRYSLILYESTSTSKI